MLFDQRAGVTEELCQNIVEKVIEIGEAGPGDLIVEVGCGTGQMGQWFERPVRYAGFDLSSGMLEQFTRRLRGNFESKALIRADANIAWPIADGVARVVFSSRTMHLLQQEHVANEIHRIARFDGATLVLGRVERNHDSVRSRMATEMIDRLRLHGFVGRRGERQNRKLFESCSRAGAVELEPVPVASWKTSSSPRQSLDSWRGHTHLGGLQVPASTRTDILQELESWAMEVFGGLDRELESEETYVLKSLRLPATQK